MVDRQARAIFGGHWVRKSADVMDKMHKQKHKMETFMDCNVQKSGFAITCYNQPRDTGKWV